MHASFYFLTDHYWHFVEHQKVDNDGDNAGRITTQQNIQCACTTLPAFMLAACLLFLYNVHTMCCTMLKIKRLANKCRGAICWPAVAGALNELHK
jgi:hypothetical protein